MLDEEMYTYTPHGSLWLDEPTFWRDTPAAEWDKAVEILDSLMPVGERINQALVIALGDASTRAREELKRAGTLAMLKRLHDEMHDDYEHYRRELEL